MDTASETSETTGIDRKYIHACTLVGAFLENQDDYNTQRKRLKFVLKMYQLLTLHFLLFSK